MWNEHAVAVAQDATYLYVAGDYHSEDPPFYSSRAVRKDGTGGDEVYADNAGDVGITVDETWAYYIAAASGGLKRVGVSCGEQQPTTSGSPVPQCTMPVDGGASVDAGGGVSSCATLTLAAYPTSGRLLGPQTINGRPYWLMSDTNGAPSQLLMTSAPGASPTVLLQDVDVTAFTVDDKAVYYQSSVGILVHPLNGSAEQTLVPYAIPTNGNTPSAITVDADAVYYPTTSGWMQTATSSWSCATFSDSKFPFRWAASCRPTIFSSMTLSSITSRRGQSIGRHTRPFVSSRRRSDGRSDGGIRLRARARATANIRVE